MDLTPQDIDEFIEAWVRAFDEYLTREQAAFEAKRLLNFALTLWEEALKRGDTPLRDNERIPD